MLTLIIIQIIVSLLVYLFLKKCTYYEVDPYYYRRGRTTSIEKFPFKCYRWVKLIWIIFTIFPIIGLIAPFSMLGLFYCNEITIDGIEYELKTNSENGFIKAIKNYFTDFK